MRPIKDLLNKIKWDKREKPEDYSLFYFDRISKELIKIDYTDIKSFEDNFIVAEKNNEEVYIQCTELRKSEKTILLSGKDSFL